jgi:hypothetical protein
MFKMIAQLQTETKDYTEVVTGTADYIEEMKAKFRASAPKGSSATYTVTAI